VAFFIFFFQAEDGIRDFHVTGVQTCALPILGGALNTIVNDELMIIDQKPLSMGYLQTDDAVTVQFNRILDYSQIVNFGDSLIKVTLNGVPLSGFVSQQVNEAGSQLIFRPAQTLEAGKLYQVIVSQDVTDLHGKTLSQDYGFRFIATDQVQPVLAQVSPQQVGWRGGELVTLRG